MPFYYNRIAAASYGTKWAVPGARNSTWPDFSSSQGGGGDCTNFISQCLYAGGWNMRQEGYLINPYAWYCRPKRHWDHSKSWASADHFAYFLEISGRARPCNLNELMLGDLIAEEITGHGIRHWMLVTQVS